MQEKNVFSVIPGNAQHQGKRKEQQDSFCFSDISDSEYVKKNGIIAILADGMGGMEMGQQASNLAVNAMLKAYSNKAENETIKDALIRSVICCNSIVYDYADSLSLGEQMGTTLCTAVVHKGKLYWASVGDSRLYFFRDNSLLQITEDHVYAKKLQEDVLKGNIGENEARDHPQRNALTSYIGISKLSEINVSVEPIELKAKDTILICSDGLYGTLSEEEISEALKLNPQKACETLINKAISKDKAYQDNVTVLVLKCLKERKKSKVYSFINSIFK